MSREYFWIVAYLDNRPFLMYGGETREQARQIALETLASSSFEIRTYPTRNQSMASAYFRGKRLRETQNLRTATRRISHKIKRRRK